jgi:hypothetical protein
MRADLSEETFRSVLDHFGLRSFSTLEFAIQVESEFPGEWTTLEGAYGTGGKGGGAQFSPFSATAKILVRWSKRGVVDKLGFRSAPPTFGARRVMSWRRHQADTTENLYPDEVTGADSFHEGAANRVLVNKYERDARARSRCIEHHGTICAACRFDFGARYGSHGAGFIHVHHLKLLSELGDNYEIDPVKDLIPVCPNCHAMIHRRSPALTIDELKALLAERHPGSD